MAKLPRTTIAHFMLEKGEWISVWCVGREGEKKMSTMRF